MAKVVESKASITTPAYAAQSATSPLAPFTIERRKPQSHDVLIDILYCGVCHSDIHMARNDFGFSIFPLVPGHEIIGRVVDGGESVMTGHAGKDPRFRDIESVNNLLLKSILCVPLRGESGVLGVIYLENNLAAGVFDPGKQGMVERVAEQAREDDHATVAGVDAVGDRPVHLLVGRDIDVLLEHEHMLVAALPGAGAP